MRSTVNRLRIRSIVPFVALAILIAACTAPAGASTAPSGGASAAPGNAATPPPAAPASPTPTSGGYSY
jgi:hypothetical protein